MVDDLKDIKRNTNGFSFTDTVASLVNNRQWKSGYDLLKDGEKNDRTYFWECLSAVGEEIGDVIYDNVLNYINNVANINTCKIHSLKSIATVLGIKNFAILGNIEQVPLDVLNLIDVFSINRAYLFNVNNFDTEFVKDFLESTLDQETYERALTILSTVAMSSDQVAGNKVFGLSGFLNDEELSSIFIAGGVSTSAYENYIEECFFKLLNSKIFQQYGDETNLSGDLIFLNLLKNDDFNVDDSLEYMRNADPNNKNNNSPYSKNILWYKDDDSNRSSLYQTNYPNYIYRLKKSLNVHPWFNQKLIVDRIESGLDFIDNYSGGELSVLMAEMNERAKPKYSEGRYYSERPTTRYSYYNEMDVKKYIRFIDGIFSLSNVFDSSNSSEPYNPYNLANLFNPYGLDETFSDITDFSTRYGLLSNITECSSIWRSTRLSSEDNEVSNFICNYYTDYNYVPEISDSSRYRNTVKTVARILKDICLAIVDIRERLKTQSQRNYMVGTKLLIEYILNEYLANSLIKNYGVDPKATLSSFGVAMIEYNDTTEYFNIGDTVDDVNLMASVNRPYWNALSTNPFNGQQGGNGFAEEAIRAFYLSTLNIRNDSWRNCISDDTYYDFLSAVYDLGKSESYYSLDKGLIVTNKERFLEGTKISLDEDILYNEYGMSKPEISALQRDFLIESDEGYLTIDYSVLEEYYEGLSNNLADLSSKVETYNSRLSVCYSQQGEIMLKYHGADIFYYPWYNYKNQVYPTFQTHPYMYNFIEHTAVSYPIENAFYGNANEDLIAELQSPNISVYLEQFGNIVRVWRNSNFDYSGYKSRYEASTHNVNVFSNPNRLFSVTHYDGTFYPPALKLYKKYLAEELSSTGNEKELVGWARLSSDMLCTTFDEATADQNLTTATISNMWHYYSHLDLTTADKTRIYEQLVNLSAYLSNVSVDDSYDIYQYGLDFNMDSFILYKKYEHGLSGASYVEKRDTPGQLWIRFNNHPIGFPAFVVDPKLSDYGQFNWLSAFGNRSLNDSLCSYVFQGASELSDSELKSPNFFYDFDLASAGKYLILAAENRKRRDYGHPILFAGSISQHKVIDYANPENEKTYFNFLKYESECMYPSNETDFNNFDETDYEFKGFFQNNYTVYAGYVRRHVDDGRLTAVSLNAIEYPANYIQSRNSYSYNFAFNNSWKQPLLTSADISSLNTSPDAQIVLGYSDFDETFSLVVQQQMLEEDPILVQDYTAAQTVEKLSGYGKTDVVFGTEDRDGESTSFDRFSDYITLYDISESNIKKNIGSVNSLIYGLNADASWIPLYPGLEGQNLQYRMLENGKKISYNSSWHDLSVAKESIELLGHSYQELDSKYVEYESTLIEDEKTGKITNFDVDSALDMAFRVYEDFNEGNYVFSAYNTAPESFSGIGEKTIVFDIGDPINGELSSYRTVADLNSDSNEYRILLLNSSNGKTANPILAGKFCSETIDNPNYDSESTAEERYILSTNGTVLSSQTCVVGTQNPFDLKNAVFEINYSNHFFNISSVVTKLGKDETTGHFTLSVTLKSYHGFSFVFPTAQLRLFIYKTTMQEFEKYHYMEPFGRFPYNAAMSSWSKVPWKDKRYPDLYYNGYEISDGWWSSGDYLDKRDASTSHLSTLQEVGASDTQIVGNMLFNNATSSFYDPSVAPATLSLMERIELSSIKSFDEQYFLSTGQITFKISEEDRFNSLRSFYPPSSIDRLLWGLFRDTNQKYHSNTVFDLSNTYVFALEDPDRIAELIGKIAIRLFESTEQCAFAYEDLLSDYVKIDVNGIEILSDLEILDVPENADEWVPTTTSVDISAHSFSNFVISDDVSLEENLEALSAEGGWLNGTEKTAYGGSSYDYVLTSVTGDEIADYLKVYVNWRKYKDGNGVDEIELFFNAQNLFNSPYHYRTETGSYAVEFKPNTYVRIKSGENDYLHITLQFKRYDMNRNLIGVRDLPILTYQIYNLSDDKPKFLLTKIYEIDNKNGTYTHAGANDVYIVVGNKQYGYSELSSYLKWNFTLNDDFLANVPMTILTPTVLSTLTVDFIYERGKKPDSEANSEDPEFVLETGSDYTYPGTFVDSYGFATADLGSNCDINLGFGFLEGSSVDDKLLKRYFPIEIQSASGVDVYGNVPNFIFVNGGVMFDFSSNDSRGLFLGRETNIVKRRNS